MACVMVVDDNKDACEALAKLIQLLKHDSFCVTSGEAALDFLTGHCADLVILDMMMPGLDGMEVLRRIREELKLTALPVVMFSAIADPAFQEHAIRKGANDYWVKASIDFAKLGQLVAKWISNLPPGSNCAVQ
ncbi:MAG TPA: response regulator [Tepidisphaeraceae bacterium]|nr:response regulator [Tepidisphaeraceae bacterium]